MLASRMMEVAAILAVFLWFVWSYYMAGTILLGRKALGERGSQRGSPLREKPGISLIVPVRNEGKVVGRLLRELVALDYPDYEVIALTRCWRDRRPEKVLTCLTWDRRSSEAN